MAIRFCLTNTGEIQVDLELTVEDIIGEYGLPEAINAALVRIWRVGDCRTIVVVNLVLTMD